MATLAPEGSSWGNILKEMGAEIARETNNGVTIKFYLGGIQGDEPVVLKKMMVGQLHGGIFTGKTLGSINKDIRALELPFSFYGQGEKGEQALQSLANTLNLGIEEKGYKSLGLFSIGMVYFVSQKKVSRLKEFKGIKIWFWQGDKIVQTMSEIMNLTAVPIPLPDVLGSLQRGILQAAYAPPLGILALQWDSKVNFLLDFPLALSVGGFLISKNAWKKIKPPQQKIIEKIARQSVAKIRNSNVEDNAKALEAMRAKGISFIEFPPEDIGGGRAIRKKIIEKLEGKEFSKEIIASLEPFLP